MTPVFLLSISVVAPDVLLSLLSVVMYSTISGPMKAVVAELSLLGKYYLLLANGEYGFELSYGIVGGRQLVLT